LGSVIMKPETLVVFLVVVGAWGGEVGRLVGGVVVRGKANE
jgi:hypothetical protein